MFEHFDTPEEIFSFKLGSALTGEHDNLALLETMAATTQRPELKALFDDHAAETRHQIANIEKAFALLGEDVNDSPSPTTKGLAEAFPVWWTVGWRVPELKGILVWDRRVGASRPSTKLLR